MASSFSEPSPRYLHQAASVQGQVYLFGGDTEHFSEEEKSLVHVFQQQTEAWLTKKTGGELPPAPIDTACTTSCHHLYVHGGKDRKSGNVLSSLYKLDVNSLQWSQLPSGPTRYASGMVAYDGKIFVFGGQDGSGHCYNDLHCFEGEGVHCTVLAFRYISLRWNLWITGIVPLCPLWRNCPIFGSPLAQNANGH